MNLLSVLIPSYQRPALLAQAVRAFSDTTNDYPVEIVLAVEYEDVGTKDILRELVNTLTTNRFYLSWTLNLGARLGAVGAWNECLRLASGDMLFPAGDDSLPHAGWLQQALAVHAEMGGYGCVGLNDLMHAPPTDQHTEPITLTTLLFDRAFCKHVFGGVVTFPAYKHSCVDLELNDRARAAGKLRWCKEAIVEHIHSANGKRPTDSNDREHSATATIDWGTYIARKLQGFPNDFRPVI